jgi:glucokinase
MSVAHVTAAPAVSFLPRLLADVGGTNARLAWQAGAGQALMHVRVLSCKDFPTLEAAIRHYLRELVTAGGAWPVHTAIAIANPVTGDEVSMTNHHWSFSQAQLRTALGWARLCVVNDFTALALALPDIPASELQAVGGGLPVAHAPKALIGAGTGLGVSGLLPAAEGAWVALQGEGGHVTLPAQTPRERMVMDGLARRYGHVSAERAVSGQGLLDMYVLLCEADARQPVCRTPADVCNCALAATDAQAIESLTLFCAWLGTIAGNLALTLGALGGVYIGGGIVPRLGPWFNTSPFRARFEAKGRFQAYMARMPVWVITSPQSPALLGAARALDNAIGI